jgi:hypothetical protein
MAKPAEILVSLFVFQHNKEVTERISWPVLVQVGSKQAHSIILLWILRGYRKLSKIKFPDD